MESVEMKLGFYRNRCVLVTGHTGFKGAWLCHILKKAGARVVGYALPPLPGGVFEAAQVEHGMRSFYGDVRNLAAVEAVFLRERPEIVFHLAAQPIVLESYRNPVDTFATNLMGTVHILENIRKCDAVRSAVVVTSDKVYQNPEGFITPGFVENDPLGGQDPYSASKACAEMAAFSYASSYFLDTRVPLSTVRAGNVIGGGDVSPHRIIPDCVRAARQERPVVLRNPESVRPYQHVMEPLLAYLLLAKHQAERPELAGSYNIGPQRVDCVSTGALADLFCEAWGGLAAWTAEGDDPGNLPEAGLLKLDSGKIEKAIDWHPVWTAGQAVQKTVEWEKALDMGKDVRAVMDSQIQAYLEDLGNG